MAVEIINTYIESASGFFIFIDFNTLYYDYPSMWLLFHLVGYVEFKLLRLPVFQANLQIQSVLSRTTGVVRVGIVRYTE